MQWVLLLLKQSLTLRLRGEDLLGTLSGAWHCVYGTLPLLFVHKLKSLGLALAFGFRCAAWAFVIRQALAIRVGELLRLVLLVGFGLQENVHLDDFSIILERTIFETSHFALITLPLGTSCSAAALLMMAKRSVVQAMSLARF
jgi:hypothetical protein